MPQDDNALARVAAILAHAAQVDRAGINGNSRLRDEFGIDSLSMIDAVVAVEDEFGVRVPDEDAEQFETVGDLVDFLDRAKVAGA